MEMAAAEGKASIELDVYHTGLELNMPQLKFQANHSVGKLKQNLSRRTGTEPRNMKLTLVDSNGTAQVDLDNDILKICEAIPPESAPGWVLHITDLDSKSISAKPVVSELSLSCVPKYEAEHGRPEFQEFRRNRRKDLRSSFKADSKTGLAEASELEEGQKVKVLKSGNTGTIRFIGKVADVAPGFFVGIELDVPVGRHDGTIKGKRLFECPPNCGVVVRPFAVEQI